MVDSVYSRHTCNHLIQEWQTWRKNRLQRAPFKAVPLIEDDIRWLLRWECQIPLTMDEDCPTQVEEGVINLKLHFPDGYPERPPQCYFEKGFDHPNVSKETGRVNVSHITDRWYPQSVLDVLQGIQHMLSNPEEAYVINYDALQKWRGY